MHIERAASDWTGVLFIVVIVVAQLLNAMRKGKPPQAPPERPKPAPQPRPQAQVPVRLPVPPFNPAPRPAPPPQPRPDVSAQTEADPETGDLPGLLDRLRKLEAARQSEEVVAETVVPPPPRLAPPAVDGGIPSAAQRLQKTLLNRTEARRAILLAEVLQAPVALRH
ncbi:MAG TPA: hypothetical protein VIM58_11800 [Candidatus Methylacidiphilales bacterium]